MPRPRDQERRDQAYQLYRKFGGNLSRVSRIDGMPATPTLSKWKHEDHWDQRMRAAQGDLSRFTDLLRQAEGLPGLENDLAQLKVLEALERLTTEAIDELHIRPETWGDVLNTLKYIGSERRLLKGKPTSRAEVVHTTGEGADENTKALLEEAERIMRKYNKPVKPPSEEVVTTQVGTQDGSDPSAPQSPQDSQAPPQLPATGTDG